MKYNKILIIFALIVLTLTCLSVSVNAEKAYVTTSTNSVKVYDITGSSITYLTTITAPTGIKEIQVTKSGKYVVMGSISASAFYVYYTENDTLAWQITTGLPSPFNCFVVSPDESTIWISSDSGSYFNNFAYNFKTGASLSRIANQMTSAHSTTMLLDVPEQDIYGTVQHFGASNDYVSFWYGNNGTIKRTITLSPEGYGYFHYSKITNDGKYLISTSGSNRIFYYYVSNGTYFKNYTESGLSSYPVTTSHDSSIVYYTNNNGKNLIAKEIVSNNTLYNASYSSNINSMALTANGQYIALLFLNNTLALVNVYDGKIASQLDVGATYLNPYSEWISYDNYAPYTPVLPTCITNFNGYVKDENGNSIQYAELELWNTTTNTIVRDNVLTNASGYYSFTDTIKIGDSNSMQVKPPNKGISNYYNFTLNSQTDTVTHNFTVSNLGIVLQAFDVNDVNVYLTSINVNYTINGVWHNYTGVNNPFGVNSTIALSDNLDIYISANGYYPYHTGISSLQSGQTVITAPLTKDISMANSAILFGYTKDMNGYHIQNLDMTLVNYTTNATIDTTRSDSLGYFSFKVPKTAYPYKYKILINYPTFGLKTALLVDSGMNPYLPDGNINTAVYVGDSITYNAVNPAIGMFNTDMSIDTFNGLSMPTVSVTPSPSSVPVPPNTYVVAGRVLNENNKNVGVSGVPVYVYAPDGVTIAYQSTSDNNGYYSILIPDSVSDGWYLIKGGNSSSWYYYAGGSTIWIPVAFKPNSFGQTNNPYYINIYVKPYGTFYTLQTFVKDSDTGHTVAKANINIKYPNGTTYLDLTSAYFGTEYTGIPYDLPVGTYLITVTANNYSVGYGNISYPNDFINAGGYLNKDIYIQHDIINPELSEYRFKIFNAVNGTPIGNALVMIFNNTIAEYDASGYTDAGGKLTLQVTAGNYDIFIEHTGYAQGYISGDEIAYNTVVSLEIPLTPLAYTTVTPYPTGNPCITPYPTVTVSPINNGGLTDGLIEWLFGRFGITDKTAINLIFGLIVVAIVALVFGWIGAQIAPNNNSLTLLFGFIGIVLGVGIVCLLNIWPWFIVIMLIVIPLFFYLVYKFILASKGSSGGE